MLRAKFGSVGCAAQVKALVAEYEAEYPKGFDMGYPDMGALLRCATLALWRSQAAPPQGTGSCPRC